MKIIELRLLFLLCFFLIASVSFGQLQQSIESIKEEYSLMGLSVVTLCNGNVSGVYHAGLKDYDRNLKVNDSTMYRVASVSKLITTMGLMALWDKGSFNLDDDVSLYLGFTLRNPSWPEIPITFRMLLSHTSSIQDGNGYSNFLAATYGNSSPPHINEL
ncbi:MAG TPA: serine hydrolase, partial [Tenuifilaceae bacterium]|nr:serine hydrolase [Tenuifilaceae bacterium]